MCWKRGGGRVGVMWRFWDEGYVGDGGCKLTGGCLGGGWCLIFLTENSVEKKYTFELDCVNKN